LVKYGSHKVWLRNWKPNFGKSWQKNYLCDKWETTSAAKTKHKLNNLWLGNKQARIFPQRQTNMRLTLVTC
jgi:hypothetical protein